MSTFDASQDQFNQYHFTVVEMDLPIVTGATSLTTAVELAEPQWYWKLNEETGTVATDTMLNGNLEYESAASTASYNILPSSADAVGSAKNIRGDTTFQIYDPIPPIPIVPNPTDMVAHWTMDDADLTGAEFADSSGNGHELTLIGSPPTGQVGKVGEAVDFTGGYGNSDSNPSWGEPTQITVAFWFKKPSGTITTYATVYTSYEANGNRTGFTIMMWPDGSIKMRQANNTGTALGSGIWDTDSTTLGLNDNTWHHCVVTYNDAETVIYIDGVSDATRAGVGQLFGGVFPKVGAFTGINFFNGLLDNIKVYYRAISAAEVTAMYTVDDAPPTPSAALPTTGLFSALDGTIATSFYSDDAKTTNSTDGGDIAVWEDQSGNGNDWVQTNPTYRPIADLSNNYADGNVDYLIGSDISTWTEGSFFARVWVASGQGALWGVNTTSVNHWDFSGTHYIAFASARYSDTGLGFGAWVTYENNIAADGTLEVYVDGSLTFTTAATNTGFSTTPTIFSNIATSYPIDANIRKFASYDRVVTSAERLEINAWLEA